MLEGVIYNRNSTDRLLYFNIVVNGNRCPKVTGKVTITEKEIHYIWLCFLTFHQQ